VGFFGGLNPACRGIIVQSDLIISTDEITDRAKIKIDSSFGTSRFYALFYRGTPKEQA